MRACRGCICASTPIAKSRAGAAVNGRREGDGRDSPDSCGPGGPWSRGPGAPGAAASRGACDGMPWCFDSSTPAGAANALPRRRRLPAYIPRTFFDHPVHACLHLASPLVVHCQAGCMPRSSRLAATAPHPPLVTAPQPSAACAADPLPDEEVPSRLPGPGHPEQQPGKSNGAGTWQAAPHVAANRLQKCCRGCSAALLLGRPNTC